MKVSIITVCLNAEKTIKETIESVNMQSSKDYEHIFVDGGSKDNTNYGVGEITDENKNGVYCAGLLTKQKTIALVNGKKVLKLLDNNVYCLNEYGHKIRLKIIHFQAGTKFYMKYYLKGKNNLLELAIIKLQLFLRNKLTGVMGDKTRRIVKKIMFKVI